MAGLPQQCSPARVRALVPCCLAVRLCLLCIAARLAVLLLPSVTAAVQPAACSAHGSSAAWIGAEADTRHHLLCALLLLLLMTVWFLCMRLCLSDHMHGFGARRRTRHRHRSSTAALALAGAIRASFDTHARRNNTFSATTVCDFQANKNAPIHVIIMSFCRVREL